VVRHFFFSTALFWFFFPPSSNQCMFHGWWRHFCRITPLPPLFKRALSPPLVSRSPRMAIKQTLVVLLPPPLPVLPPFPFVSLLSLNRVPRSYDPPFFGNFASFPVALPLFHLFFPPPPHLSRGYHGLLCFYPYIPH